MQTPEPFAGARQWIADAAIEILPDANCAVDNSSLTKAGVVPFMRDAAGNLIYYLMKPVAARVELGPPPFQICKGTRLCSFHENNGDAVVMDMTALFKKTVMGEVAYEPVLETALREGQEEIGLRYDNIEKLFDAGVVHFVSVKNHSRKPMYLFAAQVKQAHVFDTPSITDAATDATAWLTLKDYAAIGRPDHYEVLAWLEEKLKRSTLQ